MKPYIILVSLMVLIFISMNNRPHTNRLMDHRNFSLEDNEVLEEEPMLKENACIEYPSSDNVSVNENLNTTGVSNYFSGKCLISISIM